MEPPVHQHKHRFVQLANGTNIHIAEQGSGPVVLLLHGFPEIWYSWRHQLPALAQAGFHAVAPDLRGFGLTGNSHGSDKLSVIEVVGDLVGLILALGQPQVFLAAHDVGVEVGFTLCLIRPDLVKGYVSLGIPFFRRKLIPTAGSESAIPAGFYVIRFSQEGRAEADFARFDVRTVFTNIYKLFCRSELQVASEGEEIMDIVKPSDKIPSFLSSEDINVYVQHFEKSGFPDPIRFTYINRARNRELQAALEGKLFTTPALYVLGETDYIKELFPPALDSKFELLRKDAPNLKAVVTVPAGHFMQEEAPEEVNKLLVEFFKKLSRD